MNKRVSKIRESFKASGLDALIVTNELNQHYLSGFAFTDGLLVITANSAYLITDFRYYEDAQREAYDDYKVIIPDNRIDFITTLFKNEGCVNVGIEGNTISHALYNKYVEVLFSWSLGVHFDSTIMVPSRK